MKRFRPYQAGFIVLYVLTLLSLADVVYTVIRSARGVNDVMTGFSFFSYFVFAMACCYVWQYARAQVCFDGDMMRVAFPANVRPKPGQPRVMFLFRQGDLDLIFVDKTIDLKLVTRYGYVEDLGYEPLDKSRGGEKSRLFPVHEVAFITCENKRYHMNAGFYSRKQRNEIFSRIRQITGIAPEGKLADELEKTA